VWSSTHQSNSPPATDAKKSDSIAAPEPDDGSPTDHPHHETVSMILSTKVHTSEWQQAGQRCTQTPRGRILGVPGRNGRGAGTARCGAPPRSDSSVPLPGQPPAVAIHRKYLIFFP
jgi:hypothetical protein